MKFFYKRPSFHEILRIRMAGSNRLRTLCCLQLREHFVIFLDNHLWFFNNNSPIDREAAE